MKTKVITILAVVIFLPVSQVQATDVDFYSDATIGNGDVYDWVYVYDTPPDHTVVDMHGGSVFAFITYDSSTVNIYGGELERGIVAYDSSTVNIHRGSVTIDGSLFTDSSTLNIFGGDVLLGHSCVADSSTINIFGGDVLFHHLYAEDSSTINIYGYGFSEFPASLLTGYLSDGSPFEFFVFQSAIPHINLIEVAEPLVAEIDIKPNTLNLKSKGKWITCRIWLPEDYDVAEIDPETILLEQRVKAHWAWFNEQQQVAMVKFSRSELVGILEPGEVELAVSGRLVDGTYFEGTDTIKVIDKRRGRVNSNSIIKDNIEYYVQTDKSVYNLGENVEILYRVTNLGSENVTFLFNVGPVDDRCDFMVDRDGERIWDNLGRPVTFAATSFPLAPSESRDFTWLWDMTDLNDNQVVPGNYDVTGVLDYPPSHERYVPVSVRIEIIPEPASLLLLGMGFLSLLF